MQLRRNLHQRIKNPAFSQHGFLRFLNLTCLYIIQGVAEGFLLIGLPLWMAANGKSATEITAFMFVCALPWCLKMVIAPMLDRFKGVLTGRRFPLLLSSLPALLVSLIAMSFIESPLQHMFLLMLAAFVVSSFVVFADVATDALVIHSITQKQQAKAIGLMWGAKIAAISVSLSLTSWMLFNYSFRIIVLTVSALLCLFIVFIFILNTSGEAQHLPGRNSAAADIKPRNKPSLQTVLHSLFKVCRLRNSIFFMLTGFLPPRHLLISIPCCLFLLLKH